MSTHHPDKYRRHARRVWRETHKRSIPPGHHIHHADGDDSNNDPENLVCLSAGEHSRLHREASPPRPAICERCGALYAVPWPYKPQRFCSNACKSADRRASRVDDVPRRCPRCGRLFAVNRYSKQMHCSRECADPGGYERATGTFQCVECSVMFVARDSRAMYCSVRCRKRHDRRRKGLSVGTRKPYRKAI